MRFIFSAFIIVFIAVTAAGAIYNFVNFRNRNRMSAVDLTTGVEEPDPIAQAMGFTKGAQGTDVKGGAAESEGDCCPFCGEKVEKDFEFCPKCGKGIRGV